MPTVLILNGPNLNILGEREPEKYGRETLADVEASCRAEGEMLGLAIDFRQTNSEGRLIGWIQESCRQMDGIVINPAGYSHTSVALADALRLVAFPVLEVHITNIHARESFRHHSFVSAVADGVIAGFGTDGYLLALRRMARLIGDKR